MRSAKSALPAALIIAFIIALLMASGLAACTGDGESTLPETAADTAAPDSSAALTQDAPETDPPAETTGDPVEPVVKKAVIAGGGAGSKTYKAAFSLIDKKNPKVIVLCTAGRDTVENITSYTNTMRAYSRNVEAIALSTQLYDPAELREKIVTADLIIVGGGQSEYMMDTWKKFKVDEYLTEAYNSGVVCIGASAGGMCWTYAAWNDFYELPESVYKWFYGLDVVHMYYGPHFSNSDLWRKFDTEIVKLKDPKYNVGYAMENGAAFVIIDGEIVKSIRESGTEHIYEYRYADGKWTKSEFAYTD